MVLGLGLTFRLGVLTIALPNFAESGPPAGSRPMTKFLSLWWLFHVLFHC